jgi:hypothetical protein
MLADQSEEQNFLSCNDPKRPEVALCKMMMFAHGIVLPRCAPPSLWIMHDMCAASKLSLHLRYSARSSFTAGLFHLASRKPRMLGIVNFQAAFGSFVLQVG